MGTKRRRFNRVTPRATWNENHSIAWGKSMVIETKGRRLTLLIAGAVFSAIAITAVFAQSESNNGSRPTTTRYLPEYTASGDLILPKNFNEWVFVGSPLTPNALNDGKANFPEFHNVYIEPGSYEIYKKTGEFPEGTIFFKELQLTLPAENPDGSRTEPSGRGFFPGKLNGADVTVKDSKRYADTRGWGLLQLQSPRAEGSDSQAAAKVRVRVLPHGER
jgi:Cytochrome P460